MVEKDTKETDIEHIIECLKKYTLQTKIEILGNVFIRLGTSLTEIKQNLNHKNVLDHVLKDIEKNGETLSNALIRQGLIIMTWISKEKDDEKNVPRNIHNI